MNERTLWLHAERPLYALKTLRFGFFALLAYDLWTISLSHAPRYGVASFNAAHLAWIDLVAPTPTPASIGALYLATGVLALGVAVGLVGRLGVTLCALLYSAGYFWSQADSYQHHYLLCLFLGLFVLTPWRQDQRSLSIHSKRAQNKNEIRVDGIGVSALMWQMSLIYAWTALAKCDAVWLSGDTLRAIISDPDLQSSLLEFGASLDLNPQETYRALAWGVMLGEWFAALAIAFAPLRWMAFFIVPWFHISVEWIGFDIELFSYYMILLNFTLLSPPLLWRPLERCGQLLTRSRGSDEADLPLSLASAQESSLASTQEPATTHLMFVLGVALLSGGVVWSLISSIELEGARLGALIGALGITLAVLELMWSERVSLKRTLITLLSFGAFTSGLSLGVTEVSSEQFRFDYYRLWAGDLKRRGELERSYQTYKVANRAQASHLPARFTQFGDLALRLNKPGALIAYREGKRRRTLAFERAHQAWRGHDRVAELVQFLKQRAHASASSTPHMSQISELTSLGLITQSQLRDLQRDVNRRARSAVQALRKFTREAQRSDSNFDRASRRALRVELNRVSSHLLMTSAQWSTLRLEHELRTLWDHIARFEEDALTLKTRAALQSRIEGLSAIHTRVESELKSALKSSEQVHRSIEGTREVSPEITAQDEALFAHVRARETELSEMWSALSVSFPMRLEQLDLNHDEANRDGR